MPIENKKKFHIVAEEILQTDKTTVMIQNIPNKYTKDLMLELINRKFKGKYDFFYLPIDMKFQCNVGYAFINFVDQKTLLHFFREFHSIKWPNFNSEKICHLSYARLQGRKQCEEHFADSVLMKYQDEKYRPYIVR